MHFKSIPTILSALLGTVAAADFPGYYLPSSGEASTTQFSLSDFLSNGTACGVDALPNGKKTGATKGTGPGYLYASINQLAFGANPYAHDGGGPGGACGICYNLTPRDSSGTTLTQNSLTFMIIDECTAGITTGSGACSQCNTSSVNSYGRTWHFGIAADAMNAEQYSQFFSHSGGDLNWSDVEFEKTACGVDNPAPGLKSWGCVSGCQNNDVAGVCQFSTTTSAKAASTAPVVVTVTVVVPPATTTHSTTTAHSTTTSHPVVTLTVTVNV